MKQTNKNQIPHTQKNLPSLSLLFLSYYLLYVFRLFNLPNVSLCVLSINRYLDRKEARQFFGEYFDRVIEEKEKKEKRDNYAKGLKKEHKEVLDEETLKAREEDKQQQIKKLIDLFDADGNGTICFNELMPRGPMYEDATLGKSMNISFYFNNLFFCFLDCFMFIKIKVTDYNPRHTWYVYVFMC